MEKFIHFVKNHWALWLALIIIVILLIYEEIKDWLSGIKRVPPQDLTQMINREKAVVVDIRDQSAYQQGHIIDSIHIPNAELDANIQKLNKYKEKAIVIIDQAGQSMMAATKLKKAGFEVYILTGGINAWKNLGFPLTKR